MNCPDGLALWIDTVATVPTAHSSSNVGMAALMSVIVCATMAHQSALNTPRSPSSEEWFRTGFARRWREAMAGLTRGAVYILPVPWSIFPSVVHGAEEAYHRRSTIL